LSLTFDDVCEMALALPGVELGASYGTPAIRIAKHLLVRLKEDGETIVLKVGFDERDMLVEAEPGTFFVTEHYRNYPRVLVRLARVDPHSLRRLIEQAWREVAPKRRAREFDRRSAD
jgi:hypothetical protein